MAMSVGNGTEERVMSDINTTPLVDVMLVLLIIFMVTATAETVRAEQELEQQRVERELEPPKKEEPKNPLKDVNVALPNTKVKEVLENQAKEQRVVLDRDLVFRYDDGNPILDCKTIDPRFAKKPWDADDPSLMAAFEICATKAAGPIGNNVAIKDKQRVNFAADRSVPFGWASQFLAIISTQYGLKQVNIVVTNAETPPAPGGAGQ